MYIKTRKDPDGDTSSLLLNFGAEMEDQQPSLSPAARLFHSPKFSCYIVIRMGCSIRIHPEVISAGLKETLYKHPRFSSKMVKDRNLCGKKRWIQVPINMEDHVIVPNMDSDMEDADQFVRDYISHLTKSPLDLSKPLWEVHILNVKTSDAEAVAVIRIHHSIGDGASLMSLLLACTRKTSDPDALPSVPTKRKHEDSSSSESSVFWWLLLAIWSAVTLIGNTLVDIVLFVATILVLKDTKTPIKGPPGVELTAKRFLHRTVSFDHIKQVKNAMNMTINDVVLGVTQAGLSRYLNCRYAGENEKDEGAKKKGHNLPKSIRLRANVLVNLRPAVGIQELADMMAKKSKTKWGNRIGYVLVPFTIALQDDPLDYVRGAKLLMDRKKHSLEAFCTYLSANLLTKLIGAKGAGAVAHRVLCNSTLAFTNLIGPLEEISYYGHPITYIAPNVYGHPHALHMHFQSYVDKMTISLAFDPDLIPDPEKLLDDLEESLKLIRDAVVEKELNIAKEGRSSCV
ncbi:putative transferase [Rosa chinensis]|uniref:Putative transferase n=1 Tax=Rosa chinensis TaxID=74649 RepID=A0A2P6SNX8_ROSCH|nr:O-acyltransferase WSD1 isoform X2 [Rosa chinensis]PRQ60408.1 putative transferase [Rosa chinensis]